MELLEKYLEEAVTSTSNKKAEIRIVLSIPENMGKNEMEKWVKSKFSHVIKQGGVIEYDIKIK
jgi:Tfp pilus assembly PilM family ATPase